MTISNINNLFHGIKVRVRNNKSIFNVESINDTIVNISITIDNVHYESSVHYSQLSIVKNTCK